MRILLIAASAAFIGAGVTLIGRFDDLVTLALGCVCIGIGIPLAVNAAGKPL
jgi:shikimate kinase